jgi:hypothetical protein
MDERLAALNRTLLLFSELVQGEPVTIASELAAARVQIVVSPEEASRNNTQAALATLATLLARTGIGLEASIPLVAIATPLLEGSDLGSGLAGLVASSFPETQLHAASGQPTLAILVGDVAPVVGCRNVWLFAQDYLAGFQSQPATWHPADVLVALAAAAMAASEAIRHVLNALPAVTSAAARELAPIVAAQVVIPAIPAGLTRVGSWDCISAGAITNSMLWTMLARGEVEGDLRVFDDGHYEASNLNRYLLLSVEQARAELGKAAHLSALDNLGGLHLSPVSRRFTLDDVPTARSQIMIGADDIRVRHIAQLSDPEYLVIGATSHFEVRLTQHFPDGPCASCAHPYFNEADDGLIPTLATVSFWAGFELALFVLAHASGRTIPADQSYATFWPLRPGTGLVGPVRYHPLCRLGHGKQDAA